MISRQQRQENDLTITLAAGAKIDKPRACRSFMCISTTEDGAVKIGFDQEPTKPLRQGMGDSIRPEEPNIERLYFENTSGSSQTVVITTSFGTILDNRFNLIAGAALPVEVQPADTLEDAADQTIAAAGSVLITAGTLQDEVIIQNLSTLYTLRAGVTPGVNRGLKIPPETALTLNARSAITVYNTGAADATIAVVKVRKS